MSKNQLLSSQIGSRIRTRREELRLTRERLAEMAEVSVTFLAQIETGKKNMTTNTLYRVAVALDMSADYILFGINRYPDNTGFSHLLGNLSGEDRKNAEKMLQLFVKSLSR